MSWPRYDPSFRVRRRGRDWLHPQSHIWCHTWGASSEPVPRPQWGPDPGSVQTPAGQGSGPRQHQACGQLLWVPSSPPAGSSVYLCVRKSLSCVPLFATLWALQSVEFSRPEYWSG